MDWRAKYERGGVSRRAVAIIVCCCCVSAHAQAQESREDKLQQCVTIDDGAARLACYDEVSGRAPTQQQQEPSAESAPEATRDGEYAPLTDDIGVESLPSGHRDPEPAPAIRATVTSCRQDARRKYYFFFANGQVWKQRDDDRLTFKECEFGVTIMKDFFGYKMQIDGDDNRIRISRVR